MPSSAVMLQLPQCCLGTLLSAQADRLGLATFDLIERGLKQLIRDQLITPVDDGQDSTGNVNLTTKLKVTRLGRAAVRGNVNLKFVNRS